MRDFAEKVGFITGGAGGIGYAVAEAMAKRGMALMLVDIEPDTLAAAAAKLAHYDAHIETAVLDVSDLEAYRKVAKQTLDHFGKINFLFNNAGVGSGAIAGTGSIEDWRWTVEVNLMGVVYGVECFLAGMRESGESCHIVNTASMAGFLAAPGMGSYTATKFAVVGYSETLDVELAEFPIGVSVLCPAWVKTRINESRRNHPDGQGLSVEESDRAREITALIENEGMDPQEIAELVVRGVENDELYLFSHPDFWPLMEKRLEQIKAAYPKP
jgi:NAD(P)-dependent dehydrogenase (short-subunit alcohol dehydrogenase family)